MYEIKSNEWGELASMLENFHPIFYKLWSVGKPSINEDIQTAAVNFDKTGKCIMFQFNPKFWNSLTVLGKLFTISHEMLHIILSHGIRTKSLNDKDKVRANICLDIVVNHALVSNFGFSREDIDKDMGEALLNENGEKGVLCWADTIFKNREIDENMQFEYYYNLYKSNFGDGNHSITLGYNSGALDDHSGLAVGLDDFLIEVFNEEKPEGINIIKELIKKNKAKSFAGTMAGIWIELAGKKKPIKRKWETVIKKWERQHNEDSYGIAEQWLRSSRNHSLLERCLFIPSEIETYQTVKSEFKTDVFFFMDTSGSCYSQIERFFSAANGLNKHKFNVRTFCFDTQVKEVFLKEKRMYGGGGTSFSVLENFVKKEIKSLSCLHPHIFVLTDGYGDNFKASHPKKWHWFIMENGITSYIDNNCTIHNLESFI